MVKDVLGDSGYHLLAILALLLFFGAFVAVVVWVLTRSKKDMDNQSHIPLDEDVVAPPRKLPPRNRA